MTHRSTTPAEQETWIFSHLSGGFSLRKLLRFKTQSVVADMDFETAV